MCHPGTFGTYLRILYSILRFLRCDTQVDTCLVCNVFLHIFYTLQTLPNILYIYRYALDITFFTHYIIHSRKAHIKHHILKKIHITHNPERTTLWEVDITHYTLLSTQYTLGGTHYTLHIEKNTHYTLHIQKYTLRTEHYTCVNLILVITET